MRLTLVFALLFLPFAALAAEPAFLVSSEQLAAELKAGKVRVLDAENSENFNRAHLPGALNLYFMDLEDAEENAKTGQPIFPQLAASKFGALGLTRDADVVVYDSGDGRGASAAWYILRYLGHDRVRILDGGFRKWLKEGRAVTQETVKAAKATYVPKPRSDWAVKTDTLAKPGALLLDARGLAEFSGKDNGGARQGGHIPNARSFPWSQLSGEVTTFKQVEAMKKALLDAGITPDKEIITYCNGGLGRSTFLFAALTQLGYDKVKVYPGSWIEWASDPSRPIER
jgi:thiosulfate/3-mercaptopyruvate sulfurtransferase